MTLLDIGAFDAVFSPLAGRRIGLVVLDGNVGDDLINAATAELLRDFAVPFRRIHRRELEQGVLSEPVDRILVSGGGNMGGMYRIPQRQRRQALALGVPVDVLPQSFTDAGEDISPYQRVFVRERRSMKYAPGAILAPDLALGARPPLIDEGVEAGVGIWLRTDREGLFADRESTLGDPVAVSTTPEDYFGLASKFEHIVTDRLHFAIAGMIVGRRVTLLPNVYHKNRGMYESWLRDLGCRWRTAPDGIGSRHLEIRETLWKRLSAPPSKLVPWEQALTRSQRWEAVERPSGIELRREGGARLRLDAMAASIYALCDGSWNAADLCEALSAHYDRPLIEVAREVQLVLRRLRHHGVLDGGESFGTAPAAVRRRPVIDVQVMPVRRRGGRLAWAARVSGTSRGDLLHYYRFAAKWRDALTSRADPFVLALLPRAMQDGADLRIRGAPVDAALLDNLDEFQRAWCAWRSHRMSPISVRAREVDAPARRGRPSLAAFSGGIDSMYTLLRHRIDDDGRRNARLDAVVMAAGFDMPVNQREGFQGALDRLRPVAADAGVEFIDVETNVRAFTVNWEMEHGSALAAVLSLFAGRFGSGLIPSTAPYQHLFRWGSNPITDHLLGGGFRIVHDSAAVLRVDKLAAIVRWPAALERLRVCWRSRRAERNCGRCIKCYHLAMGLEAFGASMVCMDRIPAPKELVHYVEAAKLKGMEGIDLNGVLDVARSTGLSAPWVDVLAARFDALHTPASPGVHG